jgi:hypothetical protein
VPTKREECEDRYDLETTFFLLAYFTTELPVNSLLTKYLSWNAIDTSTAKASLTAKGRGCKGNWRNFSTWGTECGLWRGPSERFGGTSKPIGRLPAVEMVAGFFQGMFPTGGAVFLSLAANEKSPQRVAAGSR